MTILTATELSALVTELLPVATKADLRELAAPDHQAFIELQGGASAGDGEGGPYWYDSASVVTDDDDLYIKPANVTGAGRWRRVTTSSSDAVFTPSGSGAVARTVQAELRQVVRPEHYGAVGDGSTLDKTAFETAAARAVSLGVPLVLGDKVYRIDDVVLSMSGLTILGARMPRANSSNYALEGGSILKGSLLIDGSSIHVENFGVDNGITYSNTYRAGAGGNGLVMHNVAQLGTLNKDNHAHNVIGLIRIGDYTDAQAAFHGVLLESLQFGSATNVVGVGGWYGVVMKVTDFTFDQVMGFENDTVSVYLKSNSYGAVNRVTGSNVVVNNLTARGYVGFMVQASDAELATVAVNGVVVNGGITPVKIEGETTQPCVNVSVQGISTRNTTNGITVSGPCYAIRVEGIVNQPSSGLGFDVVNNTVPSGPNDVEADVRVNVDSGVSGVNHINLPLTGVRVFLNRAHVTVAYATPGNIAVNKSTVIGDIFGKLSCDRTEADLLNSWATFVGGQKAGTTTRNGITKGYGRISFAAATAETFLTLPGGAYPDAVSQLVAAMGFDGGTSKPTPVYIQVDTSGNCQLYPNKAAYAATVAYVDLSSFVINATLPVTGAT